MKENIFKSHSGKKEFITKLEENEEIYKTRGVPPGTKEKVLDIIAKSAYNNNRTYEGCTRSVLAALIEHSIYQLMKVLRNQLKQVLP